MRVADESDVLYFCLYRALASVQAHLGTTGATAAPPAPSQESMEVDQPALPEPVIAKLTETSNA
jgi:pre-mRNA-processing factor 19